MAKKYKVTGMSCAACSARVEKAVSSLPGVPECSVNLLSEELTVDGGLFGLTLPPMFGALAMSLTSVFAVGKALCLNLWHPKHGNFQKTRHAHEKADKKASGGEKKSTGELPEIIKKTEGDVPEAEGEKKKMTKEFNVFGMMCPHCEARVKAAVESIDGVTLATPSHKENKLTVEVSADVPDAKITEAVTAAGYEVK